MSRSLIAIVIATTIISGQRATLADNPHEVIYEGDKGPGKGKHIVFIAGDHEYRGEETLPALARILAKSYGFKCSVYFTLDKETGFINPGSSHIKGLESLKTADLMVVFLRFQDFESDQMQHVVDYLDTGRPVVGLRTSTHAFKMNKDRPHAKFSTNGTADYKGGFGRQVLGETWVGHYGRNHKQSSVLVLEKDQAKHPILRGVKDVHTQCGGYKAYPIKGSVTLARGRILNGMKADAEPDTTKEEMPVVWTREYTNKSGKAGRVFTTTHGASEDIINDGFRRMMLNGCLWALGMDDDIKPDAPIAFIGPYNPVTFSFGGYRKNVRPADIRGFDTPILGAAGRGKK
jgi:type 1 glutamine amidotransferase